MSNTVLSIIQIVFNVAIICTVLYPIFVLWIKTKGKFVEFITLIIQNVAAAEMSGKPGGEKLQIVKDTMVKWCEDNKISMTPTKLERLINFTVATANLIKKFIKKA